MGKLDERVIKHLMKKVCFDDLREFERGLFERGDTKEIIANIDKNYLSDAGECELIKRGVSEEILAYVSRYSFDAASELVFFERGNEEEIRIYLENYYPDVDFDTIIAEAENA